MKNKNKLTIDSGEIFEIFNDESKKYEDKSSEKDFKEFFQFLNIDLRDWVKENTREFYRQKNNC